MENKTNQNNSLEAIRHSLAHLLGAAVLKLWPETKLAIGPAIENGFYYDFEFTKPITNEDLGKIEKEMGRLGKTWNQFEKIDETPESANSRYQNNPYKNDLIKEIAARGEKITSYQSGEFVDLCRGGHIENVKEIDLKAIKLTHIAGAYWRGDEKNTMLTRIYGLSFENKLALEAYLTQQEEAKKRDHRVIGSKLKLFTFSPLIGAGLPLMQPRGMIIRQEIENYLWRLHKERGYYRVWTPHIAKEDLYITSGHAEKFGDQLFRVQGKEEKFIMKPMNCPHHMQIFADNQFSYRDLPVRYFEPATVYRDEKSGQLGGLLRVRAITQDDGHLFCAPEQIEAEVSTIVSIIKEFYTTFEMIAGYWVSLSVRGENKDNYLGTDTLWKTAEEALEKAAQANGLPYKRIPGEATFYGPKLDFMFKDAIGREWQLATIQCDFNLPERFDLTFTNSTGAKKRPVVIHRAISGSLERFMGVFIEHCAGNFPLWLAPVQASILPITDKQNQYAQAIKEKLIEANWRVELNNQNESIGKKIREAEMQKIPYLLIIGDKEMEAKTIAIRKRGQGDLGQIKLEEFLENNKL